MIRSCFHSRERRDQILELKLGSDVMVKVSEEQVKEKKRKKGNYEEGELVFPEIYPIYVS